MRARQERVVFVACEDESVVDSIVRPLLGEAASEMCTSLKLHKLLLQLRLVHQTF